MADEKNVGAGERDNEREPALPGNDEGERGRDGHVRSDMKQHQTGEQPEQGKVDPRHPGNATPRS